MIMFRWIGNLRLRWKIMFAPAFLILVLLGIGGYAAYLQRATQADIGALIAGPVIQAETVADFGSTAWAAQVHLYRLMATAANETDEKKVKALYDAFLWLYNVVISDIGKNGEAPNLEEREAAVTQAQTLLQEQANDTI